MFIDGENSDVTITAAGKEWKLHKVYLSQVSLIMLRILIQCNWTEKSLLKTTEVLEKIMENVTVR